jgi:Zn-dependent protease
VDTFTRILFFGPVLLFSVIAHEYAHGYAAMRQGDMTAYQLGRLTWNPLKHIDPFMTVILPLMMLWAGGGVIGGAKPVPVNPRNYRHYKRGDIIVSLAGVATNLLIALACALLIVVFGLLGRAVPAAEASFGILQVMMIIGISVNLMLIVFNLLPIPPLDGSHVMKYLLPPAWSLQYQALGRRFGFLLLIALVFFGGGLLGKLLIPASLGTSLLMRLVVGFVLPSAGAWLSP